jgi:hypothetical protein
VERYQTTFVLGVDVGTMLDKHLYHPNTVVASSQVERGGLYGGGACPAVRLHTRPLRTLTRLVVLGNYVALNFIHIVYSH